MALDGVPWAVGGVAEHGPDVARQLVYLATGGREGVGGPTDLKVVPLDVPGAGVQVLAGGASVLNRVASQQAYTVRNPVTDADSVKIAATGSSGGSSSLVICRVDNPNVDGNAQTPTDQVHGPYNRFDVIPGVPAGTTRLQDIAQYAGVSAITLARIDMPASTGTVTSSMITDLRTLVQPRQTYDVLSYNGSSPGVTLSSTSLTLFPPVSAPYLVPAWATHALVEVYATGIMSVGNSNGGFRLDIRKADGTTLVGGQPGGFDNDAPSGKSRFPIIAATYGDVRALRGQAMYPSLLVQKATASVGNLQYDNNSALIYRITYYERPI